MSGMKLGISWEVIKAWRELNKIPDSDALGINEHPIEDEILGEQ